MNAAQRARRPAEETRAEILEAAEACFASMGFEATRLEDIADRVGVRRAALFYYFKDKRHLYEATMARLAADLMARLRRDLAEPAPLPDRLESALATAVDFFAERPAFPRLVLRLASEASFENRADARDFAGPFLAVLENVLAEGERAGLLRPIIRDPLQLASTLAGATVFFVSAMPVFAPDERLDLAESQRQEAHRGETLSILRSLLGLPTGERRKPPA